MLTVPPARFPDPWKARLDVMQLATGSGKRPDTDQMQATPAQIALAWLLAKAPWIVSIPGIPSFQDSKRTSEALPLSRSLKTSTRFKRRLLQSRWKASDIPRHTQSLKLTRFWYPGGRNWT